MFDFAIASWLRGIVAYLTGDLEGAEADQRQAIAAGEEHGLSAGLVYGYARLADILVDRGELAEAEATLGQVITPQPLPPLAHYDWWLFSRAQLRLAQQRYHDSLNDALEVGRRYESLDGVNPAFLSWRSTCALAHLALHEDHDAVRRADEEVEAARAWGGRRTLGRALRVAGTVRRHNGLTLLAESREVLSSSNAALELAHTTVELGALQRRHGTLQEARTMLWDGLELAQTCGAGPLAQRAHEALVHTGARPRRLTRTGPSALTPTERRVAALAATGRTNRDLAEELFVTPKTIEMHLGNVYSKLQIQSRTQLAAALAEAELPK